MCIVIDLMGRIVTIDIGRRQTRDPGQISIEVTATTIGENMVVQIWGQ